MVKTGSIILVVSVFLLAGRSAFGFAYSTSASQSTTPGDNYLATVSNLGNADNGTSETDNNRATVSNTTAFDDARIVLTFSFPSYVGPSGSNYVNVVVDNTVSGSVKAQVWRVNGTSLQGSKITISGSSLSDAKFKLPFSLSSSTTITSVDIRFILGASSSLQLDAVANPEPATFVLFGAGLVGLGAWRRRRRKKRAA